jgi:2'-5' RNA ligase
MRLFIAVNLSDRARWLLDNKISDLKNEIDFDLKWVKANNWHITLKFLGETKKNKVSLIKNDISEIATSYNTFSVILNQLGAFPNLIYPKIIYVGVKDGHNDLAQLQKKLENKLIKRGCSRADKKYTPHLTIARSKKRTDHQLLSEKLTNFAEKDNLINIFFKAGRISLMRSELTPEGPIYKEIFSKNMK